MIHNIVIINITALSIRQAKCNITCVVQQPSVAKNNKLYRCEVSFFIRQNEKLYTNCMCWRLISPLN